MGLPVGVQAPPWHPGFSRHPDRDDKDVGIDRFDGFSGLFRLAHILFGSERRPIKTDHIVPGSCGLLRLGQRMRIVRIQKDREIVFIADTW